MDLAEYPVFCPRCLGIYLSDHDTHPDKSKRWLRCKLCGYCQLKVDAKKPQDVNPEAKE